jgi:Ni/Co efflux regulator RcnB
MRKIILGLVAATAVAAPIALSAAPANADTARQCNTVTTTTTKDVVTSATFEAHEPAGAYDQWDNRWIHTYSVTIQPNGSFEGTGVVNGNDGTNELVNAPETIEGQFSDSNDADDTFDHATYTATRNGVSYTLTNSLGTGEIAIASLTIETPEPIKFVLSFPTFVTSKVEVPTSTTYKNHGEYVAAMGGGKDAAQSCVGMPVKSNKIK